MMKHKSLLMVCLMIFGLILGCFSSASAQYIFSLQATELDGRPKAHFDQGNEFYLNIKLNNVGGVAGCAFTLHYPSDVLIAPATTSEGFPENPDDIVAAFPFTFNGDTTHRQNNPPGEGKLYFAGAAINTTDGGAIYESSGDFVLFRIKFTVRGDAPFGSYALSLKRTELFNPSAGYGTDVNGNGIYEPGDGDTMGTVAVLVGAVAQGEPGWDNLNCSTSPCAFPVLLDTENLASLPFSSTDPLVEAVPDSIDDAWEMLYFGSLNVADDTTDFAGDGYLDKYVYLMGWDPTVQNPADFSNPYYDPATDNRGPYQVVGPDPMQSFAEAGDNFDLDVYYFTSDGAQDLSGLTLRIHYDSTKLTWNEFSDILAIGLGTPSAAPQDDTLDFDNDPATDKFVVVPWSGGNWPGETCTMELPLLLFAVNFTVADGLDEGTASTIRFSAASADPDYIFSSIPAQFEVRTLAPGDVNGDGSVDITDVLMVIDFIFQIADPDPMQFGAADLDGSGAIDITDLLMMIDMIFNP